MLTPTSASHSNSGDSASSTQSAASAQARIASLSPITDRLYAATPEFASRLKCIFNGDPLPKAMEKRALASLPTQKRDPMHKMLHGVNCLEIDYGSGYRFHHIASHLAATIARMQLVEAQQPTQNGNIHADVDSLFEAGPFSASEALMGFIDRLSDSQRPDFPDGYVALVMKLSDRHRQVGARLREHPRDTGLARCLRALHTALVQLAVLAGTASDAEVTFHTLYQLRTWNHTRIESFHGRIEGPYPAADWLRPLGRLQAGLAHANKVLQITSMYLSSLCDSRRYRGHASVPARLEAKLWQEGGLYGEDRKSMEVSDRCLPGCTVL
ncbi:TPA: hypothetical protein QEL15_003905 [Stenotrophomonas maltophilia]|nr:hypothetical protein [Stenotrophomonas maltophilia]